MKKYNQIKTKIILDFYLDKICDFYSLKKSDVLKKTKLRRYADIRAIAAYLTLRKFPKTKFQDIADFFKLKEHSTVLFMCKKVENLKNSDWNIRRTLKYCEEIDFVCELLESCGLWQQQESWYTAIHEGCFEIITIIDNFEMTCNIAFYKTVEVDFPIKPEKYYGILNIDIFDAIILHKNIENNPIGALINLLKN